MNDTTNWKCTECGTLDGEPHKPHCPYATPAGKLVKEIMDELTTPPSALDVQVGGGHYKKLKIQPVEYIHANGLPFIEGSIIKYATRWREKGGVKDLEKIKHFVDLLIELEKRAQ